MAEEHPPSGRERSNHCGDIDCDHEDGCDSDHTT